MSWDRFKFTRHSGVNALLAGRVGSSASAAQRQPLDFGRARRDSGTACTLRAKLLQVFRRRRCAVAPGAEMEPQQAGYAALAGGHLLSAHEADSRLMKAALAQALPMLNRGVDASLGIPLQTLVNRLLDLEKACACVGEQGFSLDRALSALRDRCGQMPLAQALADADSFVRELNDCLGAGAPGIKPSRESLARAGLLLAMPALCPQPWDKPNQAGMRTRLDTDNAARLLAKELATLDSSFAGHPGYSFDRLFSVLCNHARILEFGRGEDTLQQALGGLGAMVATVRESIGPGRDGHALNALIGIDGELDKAIVSLRKPLVRRFMAEHCDPAFDKPDNAGEQAVDLVNQECELARARVRMMRAFDRAGVPRPVEVLRGLKVDSALIAGLVNQLGPRAKDVGLAVMGVYLRERDLANSASGVRMRRSCAVAMEEAGARAGMPAYADAASNQRAAAMRPPVARMFKEDLRQINREIVQRGVARQRAIVRALAPRAAALDDPGVVSSQAIERLGLTGMDLKHVRQLELQGLSSAAEAGKVLAVVQKARDTWLADHGPERMMDEGLLDVLRTRRQEDRAGDLGKTLLKKHDAALKEHLSQEPPKPLGEEAARDLVRAAVVHLVPQERDARGRNGIPVLASFSPATEAVRKVLASWGVREDLTATVKETLVDPLTTATLASWTREAGLLDQPESGSGRLEPLSTPIVLPADGQARRLVLRHTVRLAILAQTSAAEPGTPVDLPRLGDTLRTWGIQDPQALKEAQAAIDDELAGPLTPARLATLKQEVRATQAREGLIDSLSSVKIGTRVRMNRNERLKVSTGAFGDTVGVGVRASGSRFTGVDFGNPGDPGGSWEVVMRAGFDSRVGVDVSVPLVALAKRIGLKVGPVAGVEGSGQVVGGVNLRCKTSKDQQAVTRKLLEASTIGFDDLADVDSIMFLDERQGAGEIGAGVQAMLQPSHAGFSWSDVRRSQFMLGARAMGHFGAQRSVSVAVNNKGHIVRDETITFRRAGVQASIGVNLKAGDANEPTFSTSLVEGGVKLEQVSKQRVRLFAGADGKVVDAEAFNQSFIGGQSAVDVVKNLGGPQFERTMQLLEKATPEVHRNIVELIEDVRSNELGSLAYQLDATAGFHPGNSAIDRANAVDQHRMHTGSIGKDKAAARSLRREADVIFRDRRLYNLARTAIIPTVDEVQAESYLLGMGEISKTITAESLPVEIKLYAEELLKLARRARREMQYGVRAA